VAANTDNRVMVLEAAEDAKAGLYFDGDLLYTASTASPILDKVNDLSKAVVNNAEEIEIIAPTEVRGVWQHVGSTNPIAGQYTLEPSSVSFGTTTKLIINPTTDGTDLSTNFDKVVPGSIVSIFNVDDAYGMSAVITSATVNGDGNYEYEVEDVRAVDDPTGGISVVGNALIKFRLSNGEQSDWNATDSTSLAFIKNKPEDLSEFTNNPNYLTQGNGTTAIVSNSPPLTKENGEELEVGQLWLSTATLDLYVWANGWRPVDTNSGGGGSGGYAPGSVSGRFVYSSKGLTANVANGEFCVGAAPSSGTGFLFCYDDLDGRTVNYGSIGDGHASFFYTGVMYVRDGDSNEIVAMYSVTSTGATFKHTQNGAICNTTQYSILKYGGWVEGKTYVFTNSAFTNYT